MVFIACCVCAQYGLCVAVGPLCLYSCSTIPIPSYALLYALNVVHIRVKCVAVQRATAASGLSHPPDTHY